MENQFIPDYAITASSEVRKDKQISFINLFSRRDFFYFISFHFNNK